MSESRIDLMGMGASMAVSGWWLGFDWRIGLAIFIYALTLAVVRATINPK